MRPLLLPAVALGIALSIASLKAYDAFTRPEVSAKVNGVVQQYTAPAVKIGATVAEVKAAVGAPLTFVPHLGFVVNLSDKTGSSQLRLLLSPKDREKRASDGARVDAIELVTAASNASATLFVDLSAKFPGAPREGCVSVADDYHREVRYWTTPGDRGGIAVVSDFGGDQPSRHGSQVVVSLFAFAGKFDGGRTLRASYTPQPCMQLHAPPTTGATRAPVEAASDSLVLAFGDAAAGGAPTRRPAESPTAGVEACVDRVRGDDFVLRKTTVVDLYVPRDFEPVAVDKSDRDAARTGYARYRWHGADNSLITIYPAAVGDKHDLMAMGIVSECDLSTAGTQLHVDVGFIGSGTVVRGVYMRPNAMALVFEGHTHSPERLAELLHSMRTVFISPRWGARP